MDDAKQQLIDRLQKANNILVTVSHDPSVDQLASCIGLTLLLNKQGKHAAAVFSGKVPSTLEFLNPGETLEKNTDSLRDFIISLDKSKADKLRYKVEEDVVRIFITPYKTSLSADDLEFSEGDFNVDVVVALGVRQQEDLDQAITAHGRILHDATVTSVNASAEGGLGSINWHDPQASSLSELVTDLSQALGPNLLDEQIATALLTGIVSETGRFANDRTSSQTMSASAALLSAGANQQLVATKLEEKSKKPAPPSDNKVADTGAGNQAAQPAEDDNGVLEIDHPAGEKPAPKDAGGRPTSDDSDNPSPADVPAPVPSPPKPPEPPAPQPPAPDNTEQKDAGLSPGAKLVTEPPAMGGTLTANSRAEGLDPVTDPLSLPQEEPPEMRDREKPAPPSSAPSQPMMPPPTDWKPPADTSPPTPPPPSPLTDTDHATLTDIEKSVGSPHVSANHLDDVRKEVDQALNGSDASKPIAALNAQPMGDELHAPGQSPAPGASAPQAPADSNDSDKKDGNAPPPVPPPIPFQFGNSSNPPQ